MQNNIEKLIEFWPFTGPATVSEIHKFIVSGRTNVEQKGARLIDFAMDKRPKWQSERQWITEILMEIKYHHARFKGRTIMRTKDGRWELVDV
jgi:hypothetical protein